MKKKLTDKHENEKIKAAVCSLYKVNDDLKRLEEEKKSLTRQISNFMFVNGVSSFSFFKQLTGNISSDKSKVEAKLVKQKRIKFNAEKIEQKIDKDLASEFIEKQCIIEDLDGLILYLKECGVSAKKFKSFISVKKTVNQKKLNELGELGEIDISDLKGCYEVTETEGYIKITEMEEE